MRGGVYGRAGELAPVSADATVAPDRSGVMVCFFSLDAGRE